MSAESGRTALYRIRGEADLLLYIGITWSVPIRWNAHERKQPWWSELRSLTVELYDSWEEAEAAEEAAIKAEHPKYNKRHAMPALHPDVQPGRRISSQRFMTMEELLALPASVPLRTAGRAWGFSTTTSHALARAGKFPIPVWPGGRTYRVNRTDLFREMGLDPAMVRAPEADAKVAS